MRSSRLAVVVGLGLVLLACSSTTVGTGAGDTGDTGDDDGGSADAGGGGGSDAASGNDASGDDDATAPPVDDDDASSDDGGDDAGRRTDAGPCDPVTPPSATYTFHSPVAAAGVCTAQQVTDYVAKCGTEGSTPACDTFRNDNANLQCFACLVTPSTATYWGAVVQDHVSDVQTVNEAGCIVTLDSTAEAQSCAQQGEYLLECAAAACDTSCDNSSFTDDLNCEQQAESGVCASYGTNAQMCSSQLPESVYSSCTGTTFDESVQNIATVLCVGTN